MNLIGFRVGDMIGNDKIDFNLSTLSGIEHPASYHIPVNVRDGCTVIINLNGLFCR